MAKTCGFTVAMLLLIKLTLVSGSGELGNCMYAVNAACEIVASNNRDCKVTCETPQQIEKMNKTENRILELEQKVAELEAKANQVHYSFHAQLTSQVKSYNDDGPILFTDVTFNLGGAYSNDTGRFIAPSDGVYYFACNAIMTADNGNLYVKRQRGNNTETVCLARSGNDDDGSLTVSCILSLQKNEEVYIEGGDDSNNVANRHVTITETSSFHGFVMSRN